MTKAEAIFVLEHIEAHNGLAKDAKLMAIDALKQPEIVRCKDCIWYEIYELKKDGTDDRRYKPSFCTLYNCCHEPDWFCGDGNRKLKNDANNET